MQYFLSATTVILRIAIVVFFIVGLTVNITNISQSSLKTLHIPLPPLETQRAIVAEFEAEQALVDGNKQLVARFEAKIAAAIARVWGA